MREIWLQPDSGDRLESRQFRQGLQRETGAGLLSCDRCYKTFCGAIYMQGYSGANPIKLYGHNLRIFVMSECVCPWQEFPA
jgi:hypothetical protein